MKRKEYNYIVPVKNFADPGSDGGVKWTGDKQNQLWVQMYPYATWSHPIYSDTKVDKTIAEQMVQNFNDGVTGKKAIVNYDHGQDPAKGGKAAGEIIKQEAREDGLYGLVQFNDIAKAEIDNGEWNYWSTTHYDTWTNPITQAEHEFVTDGGALTNTPYVRGMLPLNFSEVMIADPDLLVHTEVVDDNNTVVPPVIDDKIDEGGEMNELEKQLRAALGLSDTDDLLAHVTEMNTEIAPLRELKKEHSDKKTFSEQYPDQAERLEKLEAESRATFAKTFSDKYVTKRVVNKTGEGDDEKTETTTLGFSGLVLEEIKNMAKEFSDGKGTLETFTKVVDTILDNGIVDYGTKGSSREDETEAVVPAGDHVGVRKQFSDLINKIVEEDKLSFDDAYIEAAKREPALYQAYREKKPVLQSATA